MPPRRPHSKSRLGCKECKQRRVKCDERHPICHNCERRDFDCSFQYSLPPRKLVSLPPRSRSLPDGEDETTPPLDVWSPTSEGGSFFRSRETELGLMHQWSIETYKTLSARAKDFYRMQVEVPEMALKHEFLLDSLFCLTSMHLAHLQPESLRKYGGMSIAYQERATSKFRHVLENPTAEQGPAMFWASCMIGVTTFALPRIFPEAAAAEPSTTFIHMAKLLCGTGAIINLCKRLMGEQAWFEEFPDIPPYVTPVGIDTVEKMSRIKHIAAEADLFFEIPDGFPLPHRKFYFGASVLEERLAIIPNDMSSILVWPAEIGPAVLAKLEAGDSVAQLLTMCYSLLLIAHDKKWWAMGSAKALVAELGPMVLTTNPEWHDVVNWLCREVGLENF